MFVEQFSKVAGSDLIDKQLRQLTAGVGRGGARALEHVHCFGHSHRPKDFVLQGVRYVSNPLGCTWLPTSQRGCPPATTGTISWPPCSRDVDGGCP
jgi:hypothetical protein